MHPLLTSRQRLLLYLLAWVPIWALLSLVTWGAGTQWKDAAGLLAPACGISAFVMLSPWYIARVLPLRLPNLPNLLMTYAAAAAAGALVLAGTARIAASILQKPEPAWAPLFGMGVMLYFVSVGSHYAALAVETSQAAERRAAEARTLAREAELQALRAQLNPHFLFNSLHSISALATQDGIRAREMCVLLADFLRSSLGLGSRETIPLREELDLARRYLEVERVRFGERLKVDAEIEPGCEACGVPALLLQPLVENAVKHGIAELVEGGSIRLAASRDGEQVVITLENAFDADEPGPPAARNTGLGLAHVRRRLQVRYGTHAAFDARPADGVYRVVLRFPCESPMASISRV